VARAPSICEVRICIYAWFDAAAGAIAADEHLVSAVSEAFILNAACMPICPKALINLFEAPPRQNICYAAVSGILANNPPGRRNKLPMCAVSDGNAMQSDINRLGILVS